MNPHMAVQHEMGETDNCSDSSRTSADNLLPVHHKTDETDKCSDYNMVAKVENKSVGSRKIHDNMDSSLPAKHEIGATGVVDTEDSRRPSADTVSNRESYMRNKSNQQHQGRAHTEDKPYHNVDPSHKVAIDVPYQPHDHGQNVTDTKQSLKHLPNKNNAQTGILPKQPNYKDALDTSINGYSINGNGYIDVAPTTLPDQNSSIVEIPPVKVTKRSENVCIFCLDEGDLIHMCACSVLAHKDCALEYIRFPGSMNDSCCQCRKKLKYTIKDDDTPMKCKYIFAFLLLVSVYGALFGLSTFCTLKMIPGDDWTGWNRYVHWAIIANLSVLWPLLIVYLITLIFDCFSPRSHNNHFMCSNSGCYCSGGCGDCGDCNCGDAAGGGGEACCGILCVICFLAVLSVAIAATAYIIMSLYKHYKSFVLKSKQRIVFKHEGRPINTIDY